MDKKSIKLPDGYSWDSSSVTHNRVPLNEILQTDILYENSTGSTTSITLSNDPNNYMFLYIELVAKRYTDYLGVNGILIIPKNRTYSTSNTWYSNNNQMYTALFRYTISGKTITIDKNHGGTVGANTAYWADGNVWGISKVIGLRNK